MNKSISEELKEILVTVFWFCAFVAAVWSLYIGMVLEPDCERKGFAGVDSKGCWDEVRTYFMLSLGVN